MDIVHRKGRDIRKEIKEWGTKKEMERYKHKPNNWEPLFELDISLKKKIKKNEEENMINKEQPRGDYEQIGTRIGKLVDEKNKAYGDSFGKSCEILEILYPSGVQPNQYTDMLCLTRIIDKLFRIATQKEAFGDSPYIDISGYGILGAKKDENT